MLLVVVFNGFLRISKFSLLPQGAKKTRTNVMTHLLEKDDAEAVNEVVNGGVNALLEFIQKTPGLRKPQISKIMGIPVRTLEKQLKKLKDRGDIEFRGSPRTGGYWAKIKIRDNDSASLIQSPLFEIYRWWTKRIY